MAMVCCLTFSKLCTGCMACQEPEPDPQEEYNRRVDAAYDKARDDDGTV